MSPFSPREVVRNNDRPYAEVATTRSRSTRSQGDPWTRLGMCREVPCRSELEQLCTE